MYWIKTLKKSIKVMVDVANRGWRDNNGFLSKVTVERKILSVLNEKLWCQKNLLTRFKLFEMV